MFAAFFLLLHPPIDICAPFLLFFFHSLRGSSFYDSLSFFLLGNRKMYHLSSKINNLTQVYMQSFSFMTVPVLECLSQEDYPSNAVSFEANYTSLLEVLDFTGIESFIFSLCIFLLSLERSNHFSEVSSEYISDFLHFF